VIAKLRGAIAPLKGRFSGHVVSTLGLTTFQQFVGWGRHALIAAYYGLSRELDGFLVVYAIVTVLAFNLSAVFDSVAVSRFVQIRERDGVAAFWNASNRLLLQSLAGGVLVALGAILFFWAALPIVAAGFDDAEREFVVQLSWFFIPWIVIVVPYYAVSAHLKSVWEFHWVFAAEIVTIVVSTIVLFLWHEKIFYLPLAYAAGYGISFVLLLIRRGFKSGINTGAPTRVLQSMSKQYLAMQPNNLGSLVDRYFQSFLTHGGIAALGYSGLITTSLASLLTFRDIYVVPLAAVENRSEKLERILQGGLFISVPCAVFLLIHAEPVVRLLLQRGRFTVDDVAMTASVLQIQSVSIILTAMLAPLERMFQILDRVYLTYARFLGGVVLAGCFLYLFVFVLGRGVQGVASAWLCTGVFTLMWVIVLVRRCDVSIRWNRVLRSGLTAAGIAAIAAALSQLAASNFAGLLGFALAGIVYGVIVAAAYYGIRRQLFAIIGGWPSGSA
jgi:putative peptidoglycan lipid II flippase